MRTWYPYFFNEGIVRVDLKVYRAEELPEDAIIGTAHPACDWFPCTHPLVWPGEIGEHPAFAAFMTPTDADAPVRLWVPHRGPINWQKLEGVRFVRYSKWYMPEAFIA